VSAPGKIQILAVSGSVRPGNMTGKALALVVDELRKDERVAVELIDPGRIELPIPGRDGGSADAAKLREQVLAATGLVLATPEYHGSFSSVMKLVIENLGYPSVLNGKPVALLGVAAGSIGAIKALEHLRSVCSHVGAIVLPGPVSVAGVHRVFDADGRCTDPAVEKRIRGLGADLMEYIHGAVCPRITLEQMVRGDAR